jgi:hypothetical protein
LEACSIEPDHVDLPDGCQALHHSENAVGLNARCRLRHFALRMLSAVERRIVRLRKALIGTLDSAVVPDSPPAATSPENAVQPTAEPASGVFTPGEVLQVRSVEEIQATLDATGRCDGLIFMEEMKGFCGRQFVVKKKVKMFFDERSHRMLRMKRNRYLLEGAICHGTHAYAMEGCDRCCFFFWTDRWLRKLPSQEQMSFADVAP